MKIFIGNDAKETGIAAGNAAADMIKDAIKKDGSANILLATGASQFEMLQQLVSRTDIEWNKVSVFHLDEYIGLPAWHKASFRKYLKERFLDHVPHLKAAYLINGEEDPETERRRISDIISKHPISVAMIGIGENAHLAFNDPPAQFEANEPYIIIDSLDEECRQQQVNEGWFNSVAEVPATAISISIQQIMHSRHIICTVPDKRKALAVKNSLEKPISNMYPASILRNHPDCHLFLDHLSASLLSQSPNSNQNTPVS
ncbi:MAG: glucosamine-6-phosphate deaminase [Chitinophagaceae bacterium]|nr:glucosamine-6-phosphate deaminase [Chitinophagaceae bacterium]